MLASVPARVLLAPVLLAQGLAVRRRARILPEPPGPRSGQAGDGPPLRLLIAGDSSAAGVGCPDQALALSGQLVARLATTHALTWRLEAATGATTADTIARLTRLPAEPFDTAVIALGVNDTTRMVSLHRWKAGITALHTLLRTRFGIRRTVWSGVPPMGRFPLLPNPLRATLGALAARNDAALARLAARTHGLHHLPLDLPLTPDLMAVDGYHPNPAACALWADRLAAALQDDPCAR
jgi:lysophospholipase L1-like esterase